MILNCILDIAIMLCRLWSCVILWKMLRLLRCKLQLLFHLLWVVVQISLQFLKLGQDCSVHQWLRGEPEALWLVHRIRRSPSLVLFTLGLSPDPSVPWGLLSLVHLTRKVEFLLAFQASSWSLRQCSSWTSLPSGQSHKGKKNNGEACPVQLLLQVLPPPTIQMLLFIFRILWQLFLVHCLQFLAIISYSSMGCHTAITELDPVYFYSFLTLGLF